MKQLITKILLFSLPLLPLCFLAEYMLRAMPNDYKTKAGIYEQKAGEIEILSLGESHVFSGINPAFFTLTGFNGSHVLQSLNFDFEIFNKYLDDFTQLRYVILPFSYGTLSERTENGPEEWRVKNYSIYYRITTRHNIRYHTELLSLPLEYSISRLTSYYLKKRSPVTTDSLGYGFTYVTRQQKNLLESARKSALRQTGIHAQNWRKNEATLQQFITACNRKNITLILFTPPGHKFYRDLLDPDQLRKTVDTARSLAEKNNNVHYINLLEDRSFTDDDFYDADHFNGSGAEKLTGKLNTLIQELERKREQLL